LGTTNSIYDHHTQSRRSRTTPSAFEQVICQKLSQAKNDHRLRIRQKYPLTYDKWEQMRVLNYKKTKLKPTLWDPPPMEVYVHQGKATEDQFRERCEDIT
jgi:hypothetical protein